MREMVETETERLRQKKAIFGGVSTLMFMFFAIMHVSLALIQYDISNMCTLNYAITKSLFPKVDIYKPLAPVQFMSIYELEEYFLKDVNSMFQDASYNKTDKAFFHMMNHIVPYLKLTNI